MICKLVEKHLSSSQTKQLSMYSYPAVNVFLSFQIYKVSIVKSLETGQTQQWHTEGAK